MKFSIISILAALLSISSSVATETETQQEVILENEIESTNESICNSTNRECHSSIPFPVMPQKIKAMLLDNHNLLDPQGEEMLSKLQQMEATAAFAHARSTFFEHLKGTFQILSAWNQPTNIKRAGMIHTGYSGDLFQFFLFDSNKEQDRESLRSLIGKEAEELVYYFGTIHRGDLCQFSQAVGRQVAFPKCDVENITVAHRGLNEVEVSPQLAAQILMVTIADYLDQMVDTNGWRDHHQHEEGGNKLYPGNGRPALGFYWFSSVCKAIKPFLEVVPSVFDSCETVITVENEEIARDAYWKVTMDEADLEIDTQIELLQQTVELNPFVGEPHLLLSQIHYRQGQYYDAAIQAQAALKKFYTLASCWDKRRSFAHWVGYARIMLLRSNRKMEGLDSSWPVVDPEDEKYVNYNDLKLTNLHHFVQEMKEREVEGV
ncbi:hypothetical protein CTEN210_11856 [Chaetoceros tenuissimus]|uniref:DUF6817 domain-containing protein n=1 Tax=Chaetoceros tenuissimus TaxID=426638 RepID=A0AAD3D290_9STRA|nr:hypothetical protein CTEN210_11856 [Chaetoceros tenuissimus]